MTKYQHLRLLKPEAPEFTPERFRVYTERNLDQIEVIKGLPEEQRFAMRVVANVLPFRVNNYVMENLIDWDKVPDDPIFQLTFPQRGMLSDRLFDRMADLMRSNPTTPEIRALATQLRRELNPHPGGQQTLNLSVLNGEALDGMQHKYPETVLFFPSHGQTCHSYCTFCFRWAQFVGDKGLKFSATESHDLHRYLALHPEVSDLLITGGDPMVMKTRHLQNYLEPMLLPRFEHVQTLRIGTKSLSYWPQRFVSDADADDLLRLFARLVKAGKHVAIMAHVNHWHELEPEIATQAIRRIHRNRCGHSISGPGTCAYQ